MYLAVQPTTNFAGWWNAQPGLTHRALVAESRAFLPARVIDQQDLESIFVLQADHAAQDRSNDLPVDARLVADRRYDRSKRHGLGFRRTYFGSSMSQDFTGMTFGRKLLPTKASGF